MFKKKSNFPNYNSELPFLIHADPLLEKTAFPTHTHGLTEIDLPEFLIDPVAFGPKDNAGLINCSYEFFMKPENKRRFDAILDGVTIEIQINRIIEKWKDAPNYTVCFRKVDPSFEAVKLAYPNQELSGMKFIQIFIAGDFFALTDEYYKSGVRW